MELRFDGKVILVTGAGSGIGAAVAGAFGASGASVALHYHQSHAQAEEMAGRVGASGGGALLVRADLTVPGAAEELVRRVAERFGTVDVLVNNAGGLLERRPVEEASDALYQRILELNLGSAFRVTRAVIPLMKARGGAIVNVTSIAARNGGGEGATLYAASKAAISTMTRGLAKELAPHRIRVNAVAPGIVLTAFHEKYTAPDQLKRQISAIPLGRGASADEIAGPVLFLASETLASFITGEVLEVNGGALMA